MKIPLLAFYHLVKGGRQGEKNPNPRAENPAPRKVSLFFVGDGILAHLPKFADEFDCLCLGGKP